MNFLQSICESFLVKLPTHWTCCSAEIQAPLDTASAYGAATSPRLGAVASEEEYVGPSGQVNTHLYELLHCAHHD